MDSTEYDIAAAIAQDQCADADMRFAFPDTATTPPIVAELAAALVGPAIPEQTRPQPPSTPRKKRPPRKSAPVAPSLSSPPAASGPAPAPLERAVVGCGASSIVREWLTRAAMDAHDMFWTSAGDDADPAPGLAALIAAWRLSRMLSDTEHADHSRQLGYIYDTKTPLYVAPGEDSVVAEAVRFVTTEARLALIRHFRTVASVPPHEATRAYMFPAAGRCASPACQSSLSIVYGSDAMYCPSRGSNTKRCECTFSRYCYACFVHEVARSIAAAVTSVGSSRPLCRFVCPGCGRERCCYSAALVSAKGADDARPPKKRPRPVPLPDAPPARGRPDDVDVTTEPPDT